MGDYFDVQDLPGLRNTPAGVCVSIRNNNGFRHLSYHHQLGMLTFALQNAALAVVERFQPRRNRQQALATRGRIQVVHRDQNRHRVSNRAIAIPGITTHELERLFDIQSGDDMELYDFDWEFIFVPGELDFGACATVSKPSYVKSISFKESWRPQRHYNMVINCAAFALTYFLHGKDRDKSIKKVRKNALGLQRRLGWGEHVRISDLQRFIDLPEYDHLQIVVLVAGITSFDDTTFTGKNWKHVLRPNQPVRSRPEDTIHLVYDQILHHFAVCGSLKDILFITKPELCGLCHSAYGQNHPCKCDAEDTELIIAEKFERATKRLKRGCKQCGNGECLCTRPKHPCACGTSADKSHRCISFAKPDDSKKDYLVGAFDSKNPKYTLWAYDVESAQELVVGETKQGFATNADGSVYVIENTGPKIITVNKTFHKVNLIICKDVFNDQWKTFSVFDSEDPLDDFIVFMTKHYNEGYNLCYAHNGSGYDTRLIYESLVKRGRHVTHKLITRGCKQLQLKVGHTKFRDSLKFLPGSLANLAKSFFPQDDLMRKGHFPHLFNTTVNYNYQGPVPAKKYFDLTSMMKKQSDLDAFHKWHDDLTSNGYIWNFKHELITYCENDVLVLAQLMLKFHQELSVYPTSPWYYSTAPAFVSKNLRMTIYPTLEIESTQPGPERDEHISRLAHETYWGVQSDYEYYFCKQALMGGRTDVRHIYSRDNLRYQDVVSLYPYVQIKYDYPRGSPRIEIYDLKWHPCERHACEPACKCPTKIGSRSWGSDIKVMNRQPEVQEIIDDPSFFGIVCATLIPPNNLFHPVLGRHKDGKLVFDLKPIVEGVYCTPEFKKALKKGYQLVRLHRLDRYKYGPGLWNDFMKKAIVNKTKNGSKDPSPEEKQRLIDTYEERFGMGDMIRESFPWGKNPAAKQSFKVIANCAWGKECQNPNLPEQFSFHGGQEEDYKDHWDDAEHGRIKLKSFDHLGGLIVTTSERNISKARNRLNDFYLPAGVFVPMYGRMVLYEQLERLGDRVVYHDTDSIIYKYDPLKYNIPEGNILGDWEREDIDRDYGGIVEFVGHAPKSYGLNMRDCKTMFKTKGVACKLATDPFFNYETMRQQVWDYLVGKPRSTATVPQMTFDQKLGHQMTTRHYLKKVSFQPENLKGELRGSIIYPFGHI